MGESNGVLRSPPHRPRPRTRGNVLASGISGKLDALKADRQGAGIKGSGFDLIAVKRSVIEEEIGRLGLNFTTRTGASRRHVHGEAYDAGKAAGYRFEPRAALA